MRSNSSVGLSDGRGLAHASTLPPADTVPRSLETPPWLDKQNHKAMLRFTLADLAAAKTRIALLEVMHADAIRRVQLEHRELVAEMADHEASRLELANAQTKERALCLALCIAEMTRYETEGEHEASYGALACATALRGR